MRLDQFIYSQGFGTRRQCAGLIAAGAVCIDGRECCDPNTEVEAVSGATMFSVQGEEWQFHAPAYVLLNKPTGYECSQRPGAWPSVYTLLPTPLRQRPGALKSLGVQAVGRLDQDTTGLLLLSDDGAFIHRMNSPRHHVPKVYEVTLRHALTPQQVQRLLEGVVLDDDPRPVKAVAAQQAGEFHLQLTLTEGKYHQVKRMVAAVGNRVNALHRSQVGSLTLDPALKAGLWRWLSAEEVNALKAADAEHRH